MTDVEQGRGFRITPVESLYTTRRIENAHGGNSPLPVIDMPDGMTLVPWVVPKRALKAMLRSPHVIQLVVGPDGSMSMSVVPIQLAKTN